MKPPKMSKAKLNDRPEMAREDPDLTFKASLDDLRHPDRKQLLRQHFTGAFPETISRPSRESLSSSDMAVRAQLSRSTSNLSISQTSTEQSSSALSVDSGEAKRLSAVRETESTIDIEQAINLLQELKKSASPEQLVALHKALLPTRDSVIVPPSPGIASVSNQGGRSPGARGSYLRHSSLLPPGVATRGGVFEDLLRTPEEAEASEQAKKAKSSTHAKSKNRLAALDLADESNQGVYPRAPTPVQDEVTHIGTYRPGTLRVTNGAASPDPSLMLGLREEVDDSKVSDDYRTAPTTPEYQSDANQPNLRTELRRQSMSSPYERKQRRRQSGPRRQSETSISNWDTSTFEMKHNSQPTELSSREHSRDISESHPSHIRNRSRSETFQQSEHTPYTQSRVMKRTVSEQSMVIISRASTEPLRASVDDGKVSPLAPDVLRPSDMPKAFEMPRFAQRWSHRLSHISQESATDSQLPPSPHEDSVALRNLSKRLSSVQDKSGPMGTTFYETPDAVGNKLNGTTDDRNSRAANADTNAQHNTTSERPLLQWGDSGYGSDESHNGIQRELSFKPGMVKILSPYGPPQETAKAEESDQASLYDLDQVLKAPYLLAGDSRPSPPNPRGSKKHLSLLGLVKAKTTGSRLAHGPNESSANNASTEGVLGSPGEQRSVSATSQKKLQKPVPAAVRKEMKAQMKKKKMEERERIADADEVNTTHDGSSPLSSRAASQPSTSYGSRPTSSARPNELQADVPAELSGAGASIPKTRLPPLAMHNKSRGRGRQRRSTIDGTGPENGGVMQRTWSLSFRSRSSKRSESMAPKELHVEPVSMSCIGGSSETVGSQGGTEGQSTEHEHVPVISYPYNQSANLIIKRTSAIPTTFLQNQSSPNGQQRYSRSKSGGLQGMEAGMASELARLKSRDVAMQNNEMVDDRPRMATPKSSGDRLGHQSSPVLQTTTDQRFVESPLEMTTPVFLPRGSVTPRRPSNPSAESIPPMPEMPTNVDARVSRMEGVISKRARDGAPSAARTGNERALDSKANTVDVVKVNTMPQVIKRVPVPAPREQASDSTMSIADAIKAYSKPALSLRTPDPAEDSGHSTESVTEAIKKAMGGREGHESKQTRAAAPRKSKMKERLHHIEPYEVDPEERDSKVIDVQLDVQEPQSANREEGEYVSFAQEARVWRSIHNSIRDAAEKSSSDDDWLGARQEPHHRVKDIKSPSIYVSRYTPDNPEREPPKEILHSRTNSAESHAEVYRDLIDENKDSLAFEELSSRVKSTESFVTVRSQPDDNDQERIRSAYVVKSYQAAGSSIERSRSPGGRVQTPYGSYHPYTPTDAEYAKQARAESLAKLTGSVIEVKIHKRVPTAKHKEHQQIDSPESLIDRYGGGLEYNYEKGQGVGGSAGTRAQSDKSQRKSAHLSQTVGVDLSDVPIMLRKV